MKKGQDGLLSNFSWKFAERMSAQLITLVVSIILARKLGPTEYGIIAIVNIFIAIANVFVSDGLGSALIQRKEIDALDYSSVLIINVAFSILLYLALFIAAPYLSAFYGEGYEILTPVLRVLGLRLIPASISSVQHAYISRNMLFRKFFISTLLGTIVSGIAGIAMAYTGFGVWALVAQYLINATVGMLVLCFTLEKFVICRFSLLRVKKLIAYGTQLLSVRLLIVGFEEMRSLIIGKLYSASDLAYYSKGMQFPNLLVTNINVSISAVLFPKLSSQQSDKKAVKETTRKSIAYSSFFLCPALLGLAAVAESFVTVVLTEKWLLAVPMMKMFCVYYLFQPIHSANMQAIKAIGRGDIYLKLEVVKKAIEIVVLLMVMRISVDAIAISMPVLATLFVFINAYPNKKLLDYSLAEQMKDILPSVLLSLVMCLIISPIKLLGMPDMLTMILQIIAGALSYAVLSYLTKHPSFVGIMSIIKKRK